MGEAPMDKGVRRAADDEVSVCIFSSLGWLLERRIVRCQTDLFQKI
jgi:hypothetical protein